MHIECKLTSSQNTMCTWITTHQIHPSNVGSFNARPVIQLVNASDKFRRILTILNIMVACLGLHVVKPTIIRRSRFSQPQSADPIIHGRGYNVSEINKCGEFGHDRIIRFYTTLVWNNTLLFVFMVCFPFLSFPPLSFSFLVFHSSLFHFLPFFPIVNFL